MTAQSIVAAIAEEGVSDIALETVPDTAPEDAAR